MDFQPDYRYFLDVMNNKRPERLPLYEHIIAPHSMEKVTDTRFADLIDGGKEDIAEFFRNYCLFFKRMTYDTVSFEVSSCQAGPGPHALSGGKGPIQTRSDFERFPWDEIPRTFWKTAAPQLDALAEAMPDGMKLVGGVGNGIFEFAEDVVGLEYLPLIQVDDSELYTDLFNKIGDLMTELWHVFLDRYSHMVAAGRFGDDLGFKSSLLTNPSTVRENIIPQYTKIVDAVHAAGVPFLWHSCGCIFEIMEEVMEIGIDAKHSNEDAIAPFDRWIDEYGERIGLLGGFDMDVLCTKSADEVYELVVEDGKRFRRKAKGYALGSGNSIPDYVPVDNYLAMVKAAQTIRESE